MLSGLKDVDYLILSLLDDASLVNFSLTCKQANLFLNNESFWINRLMNMYGNKAIEIKPHLRSFKQHYYKIVSDLDWIWENPWYIFDQFNWNIRQNDFEKIIKNRIERQKHLFYFTNLGKEFRMAFPIDIYTRKHVVKNYVSNTYFKPPDIFKIVYEFYSKPITKEDYFKQIELGNPYIADYTLEDVKSGNVSLLDLFGCSYIEGFSKKENIIYPLIF